MAAVGGAEEGGGDVTWRIICAECGLPLVSFGGEDICDERRHEDIDFDEFYDEREPNYHDIPNDDEDASDG